MNARSARSRYQKKRMLAAAGLLAGLCVIAGCTSPATATPAATGSRADLRATAKAAPTATAPAPPLRVTVSRLRTADGSLVTVATFRGSVRYALHNGSQDPGPAYARLVRAGPDVAGTERRRLLAAFNGGFLLRSRAGGYEEEGHVFRALRYGLASLVIDRSGRARIGVWHIDVPVPGETVYSVRQNLWPLVMDGRPGTPWPPKDGRGRGVQHWPWPPARPDPHRVGAGIGQPGTERTGPPHAFSSTPSHFVRSAGSGKRKAVPASVIPGRYWIAWHAPSASR